MNKLKIGDTYQVGDLLDPDDGDDEEKSGAHYGHTVRVLDVRPGNKIRGGDDPQQYDDPNRVDVVCSCGERWWFLDEGF